MSDDFNSNLNPQAISKGSENLDAVRLRSKKKIVSEEQSKLLQLDRVEISREIQGAYQMNLGPVAIPEELMSYVDAINKAPETNLIEFVKSHEIQKQSFDMKA